MSSSSIAVPQHRNHLSAGIVMLVIGIVVSLGTYQYQHHGLWGKMVNYNKTPLLVLQGTAIQGNQMNLTIYRPNGPDTYGSFVEKIALTAPNQSSPVAVWTPSTLKNIAKNDIHNDYLYERIKAGPFGLVVPLSAKATIDLPLSKATLKSLTHEKQVKVTVEDVSGLKWSYESPILP